MENGAVENDPVALAVQQKIAEGYQLLATLYESLGEADPAHAEAAQRHVTNATRELAAVQQLFERRGHR